MGSSGPRDGLITARGKAMRVGSVVAKVSIDDLFVAGILLGTLMQVLLAA